MGCNADVESIDPESVTSVAQPLTAVYTPVQDTWVRRSAGGAVDWGTSRELQTNNVDVADQREFILVGFPIDFGLVCPTLVSATLSLQSAQLAGPLTIHAHGITSAWTPGPTGALPPMLNCEVDSGAPAQFAPPLFLPPSAATAVDERCTRFTWNVTPIVQAWCNGAPNLGIRLDGHGDVDAVVNFFSMEASPGRRPFLEINY
jgi:hypothetical protein